MIVFVSRKIRKVIDNDEACLACKCNCVHILTRPSIYLNKGSNCFFQGKVTQVITITTPVACLLHFNISGHLEKLSIMIK